MLVYTIVALSVACLLVYDFESDNSQDRDTTMDIAKIALSMVMKWPSKEKVSLGSIWADRTCVIYFMRRFG